MGSGGNRPRCLRQADAFSVVALENGERFVWNRDSEIGYFLREDLWPACVMEERTIPSGYVLDVGAHSEVDRVFERYVRQKMVSDAMIAKSGREGRRRSSPWLLDLVEFAKEVDFMTDILVNVVRRSKSEELMRRLADMPVFWDRWYFSRNHVDSTRALRCSRRSGNTVSWDLVVIYTSSSHKERSMQLLFRSGADPRGYQDLGEMDVFTNVRAIQSRKWRPISEDSAVEYLDRVPQADRTSPHCIALISEVILARRRERFTNTLCLAQSAAVLESQLIEERNALREEVSSYRRQVAETSRNADAYQLPHYVEAVWCYRRLSRQVKLLYFILIDVAADEASRMDARKQAFSTFIWDTIATMQSIVVKRYSELLLDTLQALGNLETPEEASRSTRDGFDVYCRTHWRKLFLSRFNDDPKLQARQRKIAEKICAFGCDTDEIARLFGEVFDGLWEVAVVMFLQRPQLRLNLDRDPDEVRFSGDDHEFVDLAGGEGDRVVVIFPSIVKRCVDEEQPDGGVFWEVVEKGCVDLLGDSVGPTHRPHLPRCEGHTIEAV